MKKPRISIANGSPLPKSKFAHFVNEHFGRNPKICFESPITPTGIIICFVNRSGSNYLAECLASSGDLPRAREFFLESNLLHHQKKGANLSDIFEKIVSKNTLNRHFASKLGYAQLALFDSLGFLDAAFETTKFIYLKRHDILGLAISLEIASQNKQWKSGNDTFEVNDFHYSRKRIDLKMQGAQQKYKDFDRFFIQQNLNPHTIHYEDLENNALEETAAAGVFLNVPLRLDSDKIESKKQNHPLKEAWRNQYLEGR